MIKIFKGNEEITLDWFHTPLHSFWLQKYSVHMYMVWFFHMALAAGVACTQVPSVWQCREASKLVSEQVLLGGSGKQRASCAGNTMLEDVRERLTCMTEATPPVSTLLANFLCLWLVMIKGHWGTFRPTTESFFILVHGKRLQNSTVQWQFNANNMVILAFLAITLGMYKQTETINLISLFFSLTSVSTTFCHFLGLMTTCNCWTSYFYRSTRL